MRPEARLGQGFYFSVVSTWSVLTDAALGRRWNHSATPGEGGKD